MATVLSQTDSCMGRGRWSNEVTAIFCVRVSPKSDIAEMQNQEVFGFGGTETIGLGACVCVCVALQWA